MRVFQGHRHRVVLGELGQVLRVNRGPRANEAAGGRNGRQLYELTSRDFAQENLLNLWFGLSLGTSASFYGKDLNGGKTDPALARRGNHSQNLHWRTVFPAECERIHTMSREPFHGSAVRRIISFVCPRTAFSRSFRPCCKTIVLPGALSLAHAGETHEYRISIDAGMSRMSVDARFGAPVDSVTARSSDAGQYLLDARDCDVQSTIRLRNRRMMLPAGGIRCMHYTVDLESAAASVRHNHELAPENIVVSSALWLWRPALKGDAEIRIRFDLPPGMQVAVPWQPLGDDGRLFRLGESPESSEAPAVFGTFEYREVDVPGATLRVSLLRGDAQPGNGIDNASIEEWLRSTATDVSLAYGRFPNPSPQVVVIPVGSRAAAARARCLSAGSFAMAERPSSCSSIAASRSTRS